MKEKKYTIQSIPEAKFESQQIPGLDTPKINGQVSVRGFSAGGSSAAAKIYGSSAQGFQASTLKVSLGGLSFASGITADTSNSRITALKAGYYCVIGQVNFDTVNAGSKIWVYINVNGSTTKQSVHQTNITGAISAQVQDLVYLNVGDYVEMAADQNSGANVYTRSGADDTSLAVFMV